MCVAGKRQRKRVQQPKPVDAYELDLAALGFSSTQMLDGDQPPGARIFCHCRLVTLPNSLLVCL